MLIFHILMITGIIALSYLTYASFFTDLPRKFWKREIFFMGGILPEDLPSYIKAYRRLVVSCLLGLIILYVLVLTGVIR